MADPMPSDRRQFLRDLGISAAAFPFLSGLPSITGAPAPQKRQRLVIMFSPNGTLRDTVVYSIIESEWPTVRAHLRWQLERPR